MSSPQNQGGSTSAIRSTPSTRRTSTAEAHVAATGMPVCREAGNQGRLTIDLSVFNQLVSGIAAGNLSPDLLPAVSFLKAPGYQDGHAFYSDPIDEQQFIANEINALQKTPDWSSTAVVIAYDDSDGWYDHAYSGVTNPPRGSPTRWPDPEPAATRKTVTGR